MAAEQVTRMKRQRNPGSCWELCHLGLRFALSGRRLRRWLPHCSTTQNSNAPHEILQRTHAISLPTPVASACNRHSDTSQAVAAIKNLKYHSSVILLTNKAANTMHAGKKEGG